MSKQNRTPKGYAPCPWHGCGKASPCFEYARGSKGECWIECPTHGKIEGRVKNSPEVHQYLLDNMVESPDQLSQPEPQSATEGDNFQEVADDFTPDGEMPQLPHDEAVESEENTAETPSKKTNFKTLGLIGLALGALWAAFKGE